MNLFPLLRFPGQVVGTVIDTVLTARAVARHGELFAAWAEPAREGLVEFEAEHEVLPGGFSWGDVAGTYREALSHYCNRCGSDYTDTHTCLRDLPAGEDAAAVEHAFFPCGVVAPDRDALLPYRCSLEDGHSGDHVAWAGKLPIAEWSDGSGFVREPSLPKASSASPPGAGANPAGVEAVPPISPPPAGANLAAYMAESDAVVAQFNEADDRRLRLAMDVQAACAQHYDHLRAAGPYVQFDEVVEDAIDWIEVAYALKRDYVITPRRKAV